MAHDAVTDAMQNDSIPVSRDDSSKPNIEIAGLKEADKQSVKPIKPTKRDLGLAEPLPKWFIRFCVSPSGDKEYQVELFIGDAEPLQASARKPSTDLESFFQKLIQGGSEESAEETWFKFINYSDECRPLGILWEKFRCFKPTESYNLLITDYTTYNIPWEILQFDEERHLGSEFNVVRWTEVSSYGKEIKLSFERYAQKGRVAAYILESLDTQSAERNFFSSNFKSHVLHKKQDLTQKLREEDQNCALFYFSCHSYYDDASHNIRIGCIKNKSESLTYDKLNGHKLTCIRLSKSIVFLNACYSARQQSSYFSEEKYSRGFPELFLKKGANGVISTLVSVDNSQAFEIAQALLDKNCCASKPIPNLLKDLRKKAISRLSLDTECETEYLRVLSTFCYVYYGKPCVILELETEDNVL